MVDSENDILGLGSTLDPRILKNDILLKTLQKDKNIKNVFFTSALQLKKLGNKKFNNLRNYNLYFFLENIIIKKKSNLSNLSKYLNDIANRKQKKFSRKKYSHIFSHYKKVFEKLN